MKTSTLSTVICLIVLARCACSLKCYLCTSRAECRRPTIETCKQDGDVCLNAKMRGQSIAKGCVPLDLKEKSVMQTAGMLLSSDYPLVNKLMAMVVIDNDGFQEFKRADGFACNHNLCNSADGFKKTAFLSFGLTAFVLFFV